MRNMQVQTEHAATLPKPSWADRMRRRSNRHDWETISIYEFVRRHLPFSFAIVTAIPLVITLIFREWEQIGMTLCYSYCIGTGLFALLLVLRVYVLPRFTLPV